MSASSDSGAPTAAPRSGRGNRRRLLLVVAALVVAALAVLGVVLGGWDGDPADTDAAGSTSSSPSASATPTDSSAAPSPSPSPTPQPTQPAADPAEFPPALPAADLDDEVPVEEVTVSIARIEEIEGEATGPGDVAGPALRVTLRIVNETGADVPLDGVAVNGYYGADRTPAPPLNDSSSVPFAGVLPSGETSEGVYVLRVPPAQRDQVLLEVGYRPGAPLVLFTGAV
jgi:hypothetical protein